MIYYVMAKFPTNHPDYIDLLCDMGLNMQKKSLCFRI